MRCVLLLALTLGWLEVEASSSHAAGDGNPLLGDVIANVDRRLEKQKGTEVRMAQFENWPKADELPRRRTDHWLADVDLGFIGAGKKEADTGWSRKGCAVLIAPSVVAMAWHDTYSPGDQLLWLDREGRPVTRELRSVVRIAKTDLALGQLSEAIDRDDVVPARIARKTSLVHRLQEDARSSPETRSRWIPVIASNRDRSVTLEVLRGLGPMIWLSAPREADPRLELWQRYHVPPESGTSGSPFFWVLDGRPVVLGHYFTRQPDGGPFWGWYETEILEVIQAWSLSEAPEWTDFSPPKRK